MALVNPFLLHTKTRLALHVSAPPSKQVLHLWTNPYCNFNFNKVLSSSRRRKESWCVAAADIKASTLLDAEEDQRILVGPSSDQERRGERVVADYDWTEEWYPLYLTRNVPHDAPLGLKVFDKNLVLFRDGKGQFQCYEDRCPHRFFTFLTSILMIQFTFNLCTRNFRLKVSESTQHKYMLHSISSIFLNCH